MDSDSFQLLQLQLPQDFTMKEPSSTVNTRAVGRGDCHVRWCRTTFGQMVEESIRGISASSCHKLTQLHHLSELEIIPW